MVGETEVLHQFKVFADRLPADGHRCAKSVSGCWPMRATIRARHLIGLGSRSYGSAVRRLSRDSRACGLVGTGMLARRSCRSSSGRTATSICGAGAPSVDGFDAGIDLSSAHSRHASLIDAGGDGDRRAAASADIARLARAYREVRC